MKTMGEEKSINPGITKSELAVIFSKPSLWLRVMPSKRLSVYPTTQEPLRSAVSTGFSECTGQPILDD